MSNLKELEWFDGGDTYGGYKLDAISPLHYYTVQNEQLDRFKVKYIPNGGTAKYATGFATIDEAKAWAWKHYNEKMQPYVKPDSITDITNWFQKAKPEPTNKDVCTQIGCHYEEVSEMSVALDAHFNTEKLAETYKKVSAGGAGLYVSDIDKLELLDALCDQVVTATGVAYMMGFDIEGALKEVIRSNNSKMVNGKFEFDANGKIMKAEGYSPPNLKPYLGG